MPCLNSLDLIAQPGSRYVFTFQVETGEAFRQLLADALAFCGWTVAPRNIPGGFFPGTGFVATSRAVPWCAVGGAPAEFVGKVRVHFYRAQTFNPGEAQWTSFRVMNEAESIAQAGEVNSRPTAGTHASYTYLFAGTNYDFKLIMLGVKHRLDNGIANAATSLLCGVPQIPSFLQRRGGPCDIGVNEMFYICDANQWRAGAMTLGQPFAASAGGPPSTSGAFHLAYGTGADTSPTSHCWVRDAPFGDIREQWDGLLWPAILGWPANAGDLEGSNRLMGFLWDAVVSTKPYPVDSIQNFDGHDFLVFNSCAGSLAPYRPPGSLLIALT